MMINETLKQRIIRQLKDVNSYRIILFGSYAYDENRPDSDLDLYVVINDPMMPKSYKEKIDIKCKVSMVLDPMRKFFPIDIIVHTLPMYEKFKELDSSFSRELLNNGIVLYETDNA